MNVVRIDPPQVIAVDAGDLNVAVLFKKSQRSEHGIMLDDAGDDMVARPEQSMNGQVQGVGAIAGEDDLLRPSRTEEPSELQPWVPNLRDMAKRAGEVHAIFNNCYSDYAVRNAEDLGKLLS